MPAARHHQALLCAYFLRGSNRHTSSPAAPARSVSVDSQRSWFVAWATPSFFSLTSKGNVLKLSNRVIASDGQERSNLLQNKDCFVAEPVLSGAERSRRAP